MAVPEWLCTKNLPEISDLPSYGFRLSFLHEFKEKCGPFMMPRVHQIPQFLGMSMRYTWAWLQKKREGKRLFIDNLDLVPWNPIYGAPIGGIGCGSIGRGYRGEFCRFQMIPGMYKHQVVDENQFIVTIRREGSTVYQRVLSPRTQSSHGNNPALGRWMWGFPAEHATYHALYPRAWYVYEIPEHNVTLSCRQVSPVFPNDYQDTSLPCAAFIWSIDNHGDSALEVSITFTFKNGQGDKKEDSAGGVWSEPFEYRSKDGVRATGVSIHQKFRDMPCSYNIAANERVGVDVSSRVGFDPTNEDVMADVWQDLQEDGMLDPPFASSSPTRPGEQLSCAVCAQCDVEANGKNSLEFCLTWNMPQIEFGGKGQKYSRRYTRFFPSHDALGQELAAYTLENYPLWEKKIEQWQDPILDNELLPAWYKSALFNELYYVSDGGSVWVEDPDALALNGDVTTQKPGTGKKRKRQKQDVSSVIQEYGKFAYLEGHEYRMYNTYDVHHYASFALIMLWPKLQLSLQYDICNAIPVEQSQQVKYCMNGEWDVTKAANCVPHDIGDPDNDPWLHLNAYVIHPTQEWKDLNTKFILQVYRDYTVTGDLTYLTDMYPQAKAVLERSLRWDTDDDGIIDNAGFADQTYDAWSVTGASSYCGGMWLAALRMFCEMATILDKPKDAQRFAAILAKGEKSFEKKLWNGRYYNYDSSSSEHHNSIMADQLAGHWFLKATNLDDVFPVDHVHQALDTVYRFNVVPFDEGRMGAINGMRPDGQIDYTSPQSEEFWTGVTYGLAATMMQEGMVDKAWQTAYGAYHTCYERYGLGFQTPEAYFCDQRYRSLGYMRPLAIWAVQYAVERFQREKFGLGEVGRMEEVEVEGRGDVPVRKGKRKVDGKKRKGEGKE